MAWIEVHQSLPTHRKLVAAAMQLKVSEPALMGHLICLWLWALDNTSSGEITGGTVIIAKAARWRGSGGRFVEVLVQEDWLERVGDGVRIHDWADYAGKLMDQRSLTHEQRSAGGRARAHKAVRSGGRFAPAAHQQATSSPGDGSPAGAPAELVEAHQQATSSPGAHHQLPYRTLPDPTGRETSGTRPLPAGAGVKRWTPFVDTIDDEMTANSFAPPGMAILTEARAFEAQWVLRWGHPPPIEAAQYAVREAAKASARRWDYVKGILDRLMEAGRVEPLPKREAGNGRGERSARTGRGAEAHGGQSDPWASAKRAAAAEPGV